MAGVDLALDVARDVADAVEIGDGGSAELHHKAGHGGGVRAFREGMETGAGLARAPA